jgi:hypothetical protein
MRGGGGHVAVRVSRHIRAPAAVIFRVLADPVRHLELDGSGMLRGAVTTAPVSGVGDVFIMKMYFPGLGDEMNNHVVEYEPGRRHGQHTGTARCGLHQDGQRLSPAAGTVRRGRPAGVNLRYSWLMGS